MKNGLIDINKMSIQDIKNEIFFIEQSMIEDIFYLSAMYNGIECAEQRLQNLKSALLFDFEKGILMNNDLSKYNLVNRNISMIKKLVGVTIFINISIVTLLFKSDYIDFHITYLFLILVNIIIFIIASKYSKENRLWKFRGQFSKNELEELKKYQSEFTIYDIEMVDSYYYLTVLEKEKDTFIDLFNENIKGRV